MNLSLKDAAELVGVSKVALLKAIQKGHLKADRGDNQEWLVTAAEATRYRDNRQHKTPTNRKLVSAELTIDNRQLAVNDEVKDKLIDQLNQRLEDEKAGRAREVELLEKQVRLLTDQSGKIPQEAVEKIARLEVEREKSAQELAAIAADKKQIADELAATKEKLLSRPEVTQEDLAAIYNMRTNRANREMLTALLAEHAKLPLLKRLTTPKPTLEDAKLALKQGRGGEGANVQPEEPQTNQQEKNA